MAMMVYFGKTNSEIRAIKLLFDSKRVLNYECTKQTTSQY